jgi:hypothetical protein
VPEFFYKSVYDPNHRLYARLNGRLARTPPEQKGLRERLLCRECEHRFSRLERYGREILFGTHTAAALEPYLASAIRPLKRRSLFDRAQSSGFWTTTTLSGFSDSRFFGEWLFHLT